MLSTLNHHPLHKQDPSHQIHYTFAKPTHTFRQRPRVGPPHAFEETPCFPIWDTRDGHSNAIGKYTGTRHRGGTQTGQ